MITKGYLKDLSSLDIIDLKAVGGLKIVYAISSYKSSLTHPWGLA